MIFFINNYSHEKGEAVYGKITERGAILKYKSLIKAGVLGMVVSFFLVVTVREIMAGGEAKDKKEIKGNRGYLVGGSGGKKATVEEKKHAVKRQGVKPEFFKARAAEVEKHIEATKTVDQAVPEKIGDIGPKGYLVGTPKEKPVKKEKITRGKGGFADGFDKAMEEAKEFNRQVRNRPYPADQSLEGTKGSYIYGEPPAEKAPAKREIARQAGLKPQEILPALGKGIENLHKTWNIKPDRSKDKEIWGFRFPDMPREEKKGITKHRGDIGKTTGSFIEAVGADIEKHKASAPIDK